MFVGGGGITCVANGGSRGGVPRGALSNTFCIIDDAFVRRNGPISLAIFGALGRMCAVFRGDQCLLTICVWCVARQPHCLTSIYGMSSRASSQLSRIDSAASRGSL